MALKVQQEGRHYFWFIKTNNHYKGRCGNTLMYITNRCHISQ